MGTSSFATPIPLALIGVEEEEKPDNEGEVDARCDMGSGGENDIPEESADGKPETEDGMTFGNERNDGNDRNEVVAVAIETRPGSEKNVEEIEEISVAAKSGTEDEASVENDVNRAVVVKAVENNKPEVEENADAKYKTEDEKSVGNDGSEVVIAVEGNKNNKSEVEEGAVIVIVEFVKHIKPEVNKDIKPEVVVVNNPKVGGALALVGMERKNKDETKPEEETNIGNGNEYIGNEEFEGFENDKDDEGEESAGVVMGRENGEESKPEEETNIGNGNECIGNEEFEGFEEEFGEFEGLEIDKYKESCYG